MTTHINSIGSGATKIVVICPSLSPIVTLASRLIASSLEVSNLKGTSIFESIAPPCDFALAWDDDTDLNEE